MHVKKGDIIRVISGSYKDQTGKVIRVLPKTSQVIVKNLNLKTKHVKPNQEEKSGTIASFEAAIHSSNVMLCGLKKQSDSQTAQLQTSIRRNTEI